MEETRRACPIDSTKHGYNFKWTRNNMKPELTQSTVRKGYIKIQSYLSFIEAQSLEWASRTVNWLLANNLELLISSQWQMDDCSCGVKCSECTSVSRTTSLNHGAGAMDTTWYCRVTVKFGTTRHPAKSKNKTTVVNKNETK